MVAREPSATNRHQRPKKRAAQLLVLWRRLLTRILAAIRTAGRALTRNISASPGRFATLARSVQAVVNGQTQPDNVPQPRTIAIAALCSGVLLAMVLGIATGSGTRAVLSALVGALWVTARLLVMRVAAPSGKVDTEGVTDAWAAGAIPYAFAANAPLRLVAWLLGGYLTLRVLKKRGVRPADAWAVTGWGYGVEALGVVIVWLVRNLIVAALFLG